MTGNENGYIKVEASQNKVAAATPELVKPAA
jgi:hypothetical protein